MSASTTWSIDRPLPHVWAVALACGIGAILGWWTYERLLRIPEVFAIDFTYPWRAARHLLAGRDPYANMPRAPYAQAGPFLYPLPGALLALPFAPFAAPLAGALFMGISTLALVYALARRAAWQLLMLLSPSFALAYLNVQFSPLMVAATLLPWLAWVAAAKPNLGLVAFAFRPSRVMVIGGMILVAISFALVPLWPLGWLTHLRQQQTQHLPAVMSLGAVGLVGLLRWRSPEGRLLAGMTVVPMSVLPYDHLFLWLIPRTWRESLALSAAGWAAYLAFLATAPHDLRVTSTPANLTLALGFYLPAAVMVLRGSHRSPRVTAARPAEAGTV